jgi:hypothetical protein
MRPRIVALIATAMLAMVAAHAALAKYWHPGERSAEEPLNTIGRIFDHEDVVAALIVSLKSTCKLWVSGCRCRSPYEICSKRGSI